MHEKTGENPIKLNAVRERDAAISQINLIMSCFDRANGLGHICPMKDQSELTTSWQMIVGGLEIQTDMERLAGRNPLHFVSIFWILQVDMAKRDQLAWCRFSRWFELENVCCFIIKTKLKTV